VSAWRLLAFLLALAHGKKRNGHRSAHDSRECAAKEHAAPVAAASRRRMTGRLRKVARAPCEWHGPLLVKGLKRRKLFRPHLKDLFRTIEVLQPMLAEVGECVPGHLLVLEQIVRRVRNQNLAAMP
jgi:hypothetical protein